MGGPYSKAGINLLGAVIGGLLVAWDGSSSFSSIDARHWLIAGLAVLGSTAVVWWTENGPWHQTIKFVIALLSAGIGSLVIALDDNHITQVELLTAFGATVAAAGAVYQLKDPAETRNRAQTA